MNLRATYSGRANHWRAVLKDGKRVIWTCPHIHRVRDGSSATFGICASGCAATMKMLIEKLDYGDQMRNWITQAYRHSASQARLDRMTLALIESLEPQAAALREKLAAGE